MVELKLNTYKKISMSEKTFILVISGVFMMAWFEARTDEICGLVLKLKDAKRYINVTFSKFKLINY